jgi:L-threonylcarbamoyladenylate synthase
MSPNQFVSRCTADSMEQAARKLQGGSLVAFPTETVYGLGADATNPQAVKRIYDVKGRPQDHPLIVHISSAQLMGEWADEIPTYAIELARAFWPGPMTLIVKRSSLAQDFITGGQNTVGLRVPDHVVALALLGAFEKLGGKGVAAPSANRFGHLSPTTSQAVTDELSEYLQESDLILDGGSSQVGVESTIIDCTEESPKILRPGAITQAMIEEVTHLKVSEKRSNEIRVSGSLEKHYSPMAQVVLDRAATSGEGLIALASVATPQGAIRLAAPQTIEEFSHLLYEALRSADTQGISTVVVSQPQGDGLAVAIRDRLMRAAKGR